MTGTFYRRLRHRLGLRGSLRGLAARVQCRFQIVPSSKFIHELRSRQRRHVHGAALRGASRLPGTYEGGEFFIFFGEEGIFRLFLSEIGSLLIK